MKAAWVIVLLPLAACGPAPLPPGALAPGAGPIPVSHGSFGPAPQPLPEVVLAALPADVPLLDVFVAPDGCYFFLQNSELMLLTVNTGGGEAPYCP